VLRWAAASAIGSDAMRSTRSSREKEVMAGKGRGGDGLKYLGVRNGRKWWEARLKWIDPLTGKVCNTKQKFVADSKLLAAQERAARIERLRDGTGQRAERKRFGEALDEFLETIQVYSTRKSWRSFSKRLRVQFGEWWLDAMTARHMQDYLDSLELSASSVSTLRAILRKVFSYAMRKQWVTTNPAKDLGRRDDTRERALREALGTAPKRSLTLDQAARFLADIQLHEPRELYLLIATQMVLGCRFAEVSALTWEDVDLDTGLVTIRRGQVDSHVGATKGKYARLVAIDLELRRDLKVHRERMREMEWPDHETLVFPRSWSRIRRTGNHVARATASAAIKRAFARLGWHDMAVATHVARHTMHNVAREHTSALLLRKVVGHTSEKMSLNYTSAEKAEVIELAERLGSSFRSVTKSVTGTSDSGTSDEND
jgi:integrase